MTNRRILRVEIARPLQAVADFIRDYRRLPEWLTFITGVREEAGQWFMETPEGPMQIEFLQTEIPGVVGHCVTLSDGRQFYNQMRVRHDGAHSEVEFALDQSPGMSDEQFAADAETVQADLENLRRLLEQQPLE